MGWFVPSLEPTSTCHPRHPAAGLRAVFRSTPKGIEFEDAEDHKAIGLGFVVVQLPDMPYHQLLRSGFSPESLVRTTREGRWKLVLGPGALLRVSLAVVVVVPRTDTAGEREADYHCIRMLGLLTISARMHLLLLDHGV